MDTRFWGPSGWRLLHLITFTYEPKEDKQRVKEMFDMLPYVLPCKFCRQSLSQYYEKDPLTPATLKSRPALSRWLWRIHNAVNAKLRGQGIMHTADPPFASVQKIYAERIAAGCTRTDFEGWDFLFSVAENHPFTQSAKNSVPIPSPTDPLDTPDMRNRWNTMKPEERIIFYERFWKSIGPALPFQEWRTAWIGCAPRSSALSSKVTWMKELWRIRCCLERRLELVNREEYQNLCKRLAMHRSGCGQKTRAKTCRREKSRHLPRRKTAKV